MRDRVVEDGAQQERRDHADPRGDRDQRDDHAESTPVGPEQTQDAPRVALALGIHQRWRLRRPPATRASYGLRAAAAGAAAAEAAAAEGAAAADRMLKTHRLGSLTTSRGRSAGFHLALAGWR